MYRILLLLLFSLAFFSCSNQRSPKLTLAVGGTPAELRFWQQLVNDYNDQHQANVEILSQPTDSEQRRQGLIIPLNAGKKDPDLFLMDVAWIAQFAASGWLTELDQYFSREYLSFLFPNILELADRYQGRLIALPVNVDGGLLYYRKDLVAKPPKTWEQLLKISEKIINEQQELGRIMSGFVWQGAQYEGLICTFLEVAGSLETGGIYPNVDPFNSTDNIQAISLMRDMIHKYRISPANTYSEMKEEQVRQYFQRGKAVFERNWPYAWQLHQAPTSVVKGKVGVTTMPAFEGESPVSTLGGWHIGLSGYSDKKGEAVNFIKYLLSREVQKQLVVNLSWNPARKDLYRDQEIIKKMPHFPELQKVFENCRPRPLTPYYTRLSAVQQVYLNKILSGKVLAREGLEQAQQQLSKIKERYER